MNEKNLIFIFLLFISICSCEKGHQVLLNQQAEKKENVEIALPENDEQQEVEVTFKKDILALIQNRCSLCHSQNSGLPFWEDFSTLLANIDKVNQRVVVKKDMPRGNATNMTEEEREILAQWIEDGAQFE
jgi:uncharacterized membrane protein